MIWVVFVLMVAGAVGLMLVPALGRRKAPPPRLDFDLAVYKDQLAEIGKDLDRGLLSPEQAAAARVEIQRRMLAAADGDAKEKAAVGRTGSLKALVAIMVMVPLVAFGLYFRLGAPELKDQPIAARAGEIEAARSQVATIQSMVERLATRLKQQPDDGKGWAMLGRSLQVLGQPEQALDAYARALPLLPKDERVRMDYAAAMLDSVPTGSPPPPAFMAVMHQLLDINPDNLDALYWVGAESAQSGDLARAGQMWNRLLDSLPPDSPYRGELATRIKQLQQP